MNYFKQSVRCLQEWFEQYTLRQNAELDELLARCRQQQ